MIVFRHIVVPVLAPYLLVLAMVMYAAVRPAPRPRPTAAFDLGRLLGHITDLVAGGYVTFLAIVLVFHRLLVGDRGAVRSAAWSGVFLAAVSTPVFVALSWLEARLRRGHRRGPRC